MPLKRIRQMTRHLLPNDILLSQAGDFLREGREVILRARGNSMLPFIRDGRDSVVLHSCDDPQVGDIVLVRLPGRYVMHRIIRHEGETYTMMGDGNVRGTESFRKEDVLGKVTGIIRDGGREIKPGKGRLWHLLLPVRRWILAIYRRIPALGGKGSTTTV